MMNQGKVQENKTRHNVAKPVSARESDKNDTFSDFGISVEEMVRRCRESGHTVWAYARVSTKAQDLTRQIDHFLKLTVRRENIIQDKATGTNFERDGFKRLLGLVREGDIILFTELDRFGRDFMENVAFAMRITVEKRVGIGFIENRGLNRMGDQSPLHALISMIMFLTQAYSSHDEHEKILSRTSQGRRVKAKAGAAFGRKPIDITDKFREMEDGILEGRISHNKAGKALGVNYRTLKKWVRYAKKQRMKKAVEAKMALLSKKAKAWCKKAMGMGTALTIETVCEVKALVERFIASAEKLAESLSVWRRTPVVDEDGTIIRPQTYQRKETELDAEVADLEASIEGINAFTDELIRIMESGDKNALIASEPVGQEIIKDTADRIGKDGSMEDFDSAGRPGSKPFGKVDISDLFLAVTETMKEIKEKLVVLKQKTVAEF